MILSKIQRSRLRKNIKELQETLTYELNEKEFNGINSSTKCEVQLIAEMSSTTSGERNSSAVSLETEEPKQRPQAKVNNPTKSSFLVKYVGHEVIDETELEWRIRSRVTIRNYKLLSCGLAKVTIKPSRKKALEKRMGKDFEVQLT